MVNFNIHIDQVIVAFVT